MIFHQLSKFFKWKYYLFIDRNRQRHCEIRNMKLYQKCFEVSNFFVSVVFINKINILCVVCVSIMKSIFIFDFISNILVSIFPRMAFK